MKPIEKIISSLRIAMTDARQNESHFESWMILNEAICDAIEALAEQPAQQQEPDGRVISANCEYATVQWLHQTSNIGGGDPKNSRSWPIGGEDVYLSPPASKPWVGLTLNDLPDSRFGDPTFYAGAQWAEAKLKEKNA